MSLIQLSTNIKNGIMIFAAMIPLPDLVHHLLAHVDALVLVDPPPDVDLTRTHGTRTHAARADTPHARGCASKHATDIRTCTRARTFARTHASTQTKTNAQEQI